MTTAGEPDYSALLAFRTALRRFNRWSEAQASAVGLTHAQHQLLLAVKGHDDPRGPTIGDVADYLLLRHHSTVELVNRAQAAGLVQRNRDGDDGRVVRLHLTAAGEERIRQLTQLHVDELSQLEPLLADLVVGRAVGSGELPLKRDGQRPRRSRSRQLPDLTDGSADGRPAAAADDRGRDVGGAS